MGGQAFYTVLTMLPVAIFYSYKWAHTLCVTAIILLVVWNGGGYYIEVFSKQYRKQFTTILEETAPATTTAVVTLLSTPPNDLSSPTEVAKDDAVEEFPETAKTK